MKCRLPDLYRSSFLDINLVLKLFQGIVGPFNGSQRYPQQQQQQQQRQQQQQQQREGTRGGMEEGGQLPAN